MHTSSRIYSSFATQAQTSSSNLDKWLTINDLEEVEVTHAQIVDLHFLCQTPLPHQVCSLMSIPYQLHQILAVIRLRS